MYKENTFLFSTLRPCDLPVIMCWVDYAVQCFLEMLVEKISHATSYTRTLPYHEHDRTFDMVHIFMIC